MQTVKTRLFLPRYWSLTGPFARLATVKRRTGNPDLGMYKKTRQFSNRLGGPTESLNWGGTFFLGSGEWGLLLRLQRTTPVAAPRSGLKAVLGTSR